MTRTTFSVICGSALLAALAYALLQARAPQTGATDASNAQPRPDVVVDEINADEPDGEPESRDPPAEDREPAERKVASVAPLPAMPADLEDLRREAPLLAPVIDAGENDLGLESKDPLWAATMETRILNEISQKALGLEITGLQVDCRTSLCRVQMVFPLELAHAQFAPVTAETVWTGHEPISFFIKALDLEFRQPVVAGLNSYGTPVLVGYVVRGPQPPSP